MPLVVSVGISGGGDNSFCRLGTPGNPTEMEAIATVIVAVDAPVHAIVAGSVKVVAVT